MSAKRLAPEEWAAARAAWESEPALSIAALAVRLGVSKQAAAAKAKRDGWEKKADLRDLAVKAHTAADKVKPPPNPDPPADVDDVDRTVNVAAEPDKRPVTEHPDPVASRTEVITRHRQEWRAARGNLYEAIKTKDFERGKVAKITIEALSIMQRGERAAWGLDAIDPDKQPPTIIVERG